MFIEPVKKKTNKTILQLLFIYSRILQENPASGGFNCIVYVYFTFSIGISQSRYYNNM